MSGGRLRVRETGLNKLEPWQGSPRLNDHAVERVARSIRTFGFNVPILCDQKMRIVAGHTRFKAAQKLGMKSVPAIELHMSDAQSRAFAIADNKTGEIADWDFPKLRKVLEELRSEDSSLQDLGFSDGELVALLDNEGEPDWEEFDQCISRLADDTYVLLPVKVRPEMKEPLKAAMHKRAAELGIDDRDTAVLAGKVIQELLGVGQ